MSKLFIISTPIGNLDDITFRAIEILKNVDLVLCEDTRVTKRLLEKYQITKTLLSYHQRSRLPKTDQIISELESEKNLALVTDAGTPGISDPGNELVGKLLEHFRDEIEIIPIPGPSALTALIQVSGINMKEFLFLGFPPHKKGRQTIFEKIAQSDIPVVYYDSPYRFLKNLQFLSQLSQGRKKVVVGRELTKIFEEVKRDQIDEVIKHYQSNPDKIKGEFVIIAH